MITQCACSTLSEIESNMESTSPKGDPNKVADVYVDAI